MSGVMGTVRASPSAAKGRREDDGTVPVAQIMTSEYGLLSLVKKAPEPHLAVDEVEVYRNIRRVPPG